MTTHAGVEAGGLHLIVFKDEAELRQILAATGLKVNDDGYIEDESGEIIHCSSCPAPITVSNVGHILPGSRYIYCKDQLCILDYFERFG